MQGIRVHYYTGAQLSGWWDVVNVAFSWVQIRACLVKAVGVKLDFERFAMYTHEKFAVIKASLIRHELLTTYRVFCKLDEPIPVVFGSHFLMLPAALIENILCILTEVIFQNQC